MDKEIDTRRTRIAEIERELARLQALHDLAMSAFRFDKANRLHPRIAALDDERRALVAGLPEEALPPEPAAGVVPVLARPRRLRHRR